MTTEVATGPAVSVEGLKVWFPVYRGVISRASEWVKAVDGISFQVDQGEIFALVGESGCGKSTTALAILDLVKVTAGAIRLYTPSRPEGVAISDLSRADRRSLRRDLQIIFQDPFSSLNPRMTVRHILSEPLDTHGLGTRAERVARIRELLLQVGLSPDFLDRYPHEFSGGQRQRIGIARALATRPKIVIADEPVSSLDVSIQAQIINLLIDLREQYGQTLIIISHDLAVVRHMADRIAVMYLGKIMEYGHSEAIFHAPAHPYTRLLLASVPEPSKKREALAHVEEMGAAQENGPGCPFFPRCKIGQSICRETMLAFTRCGKDHFCACHFAGVGS